MRRLNIALAAASGLLAINLAGAVARAEPPPGPSERIDRSIALRPGAAVKVSSIAGPVTVETGDGDHAELHLERQARSQAELACRKAEIVESADALSIRLVHVSQTGRCQNIETRESLRLVLPRRVDLSLSAIAGSVEVAPIEGAAHLQSIAGRTRLAGVRSAEISSVAGRLSVALGPIDPRGVRISSVAGPIELRFRPGSGAEVEATSLIGRMRSDSPGIEISEDQRVHRARIGPGGPRVSLSSIVGPIRLSIS